MEKAIAIRDLIQGKSYFEMTKDALQHAGDECRTRGWIEQFIKSKYSVNPRAFNAHLTRTLAKGVKSRLFQLVPTVAGGPLYTMRQANEDEERATALARVIWLYFLPAKKNATAISQSMLVIK